MSETTKLHNYRNQLRYRLLVTVSSAALLAGVAAKQVDAAENDHPTIWVEVGGGFDQMSTGEVSWLPPNLTPPQSNPIPPFGKLPDKGFDTDLKLSFTPEDSNWVYSASVRYGRATRGLKHNHDQTYKLNNDSTANGFTKYVLTNLNFANALQKNASTHAILDFQAGKDVGLGMFGGKSILSAGIRVAQLNENSDGHLTAFLSAPAKYPPPPEVVHKANFVVSRSFDGVGPSLSWDGSAPVAGTLSEGFSFDWGANAAILFGRQKANVMLHTRDAQYFNHASSGHQISQIANVLSQSTQTPARNKTVVVPNVGGFAGLSWHLPNAKISLGYRADFFFSAIDGGLLTSQKETRGFYGPFANVSIGIGG